MRGAMLDLETMGTRSNAPVVAIGACGVDPETGEVWGSFHQVIDLADAMKFGQADGDTITWWLNQSDAARKIFSPFELRAALSVALISFAEWCHGTVGPRKSIEMWGNGSDFDNVVLGNAYRETGLDLPWLFRNNRCYRTAKSLAPEIPFVRMGVHHNALDDALSQAHHLVKVFKEVKK